MISTFSTFNLPWPHFWPFSPAQPPLKSLDQLFEKLQSPEFSLEKLDAMKDNLKVLMRDPQIGNQQLKQLIEKVISWGLTTTDPIKVLTLLSEVLELDQLIGLVCEKAAEQGTPFTSINEWAEIRKDLYKVQNRETVSNASSSHWKTVAWRIINFIPNLMNLFINSLSYLDCHKKFTSLWDRFSLFDIVYKFCLIPYALVQVLTPLLVTPMKIYLTAGLIIIGISLFVAAYKKWVMPIPEEILNCENLDKKAALGSLESKVGEPLELAHLQSALLAESNVLLIGEPGIGKTALMERYVQLKKEGKLPAPLQKLHNFSFDCGALLGTNTYGYSELIYQTRTQIEGIEKEVVIFLDELDQIVTNRNAFEAIKTHFLSEGGPRIVAATTPEGYAKIIQAVGGSFGRRVQQIHLSSPNETMLHQVLWDFLHREASDLIVDASSIPKLIELLRQHPNFSPGIGEIAKAKKILKEAIGHSRYSFTADYITPIVAQQRNFYQMIQARLAATFTHNPADVATAQELRGRISRTESELADYRAAAKKIQDFVREQTKLKKRYSQLLQQAATTGTQEPSNDIKKLYLLYEFYGINAFQTKLDQEIDSIRRVQAGVPTTNLHIKIDAFSIAKTFEESVRLEERLRGQ